MLNGWTQSGTRPEFTIVSGVSTGALIAPFAFLGPSYDGVLHDLYTSGVAESLVTSPRLQSVLFGSGVFGNRPLRELVAHYVDGPMLARIAAEYAKGRCLAVVTTDLDAQRAVVWDMGRIASYGSPAALELFRDVLTASASVPVVFPPMLIDVAANGRTIQEMHVDGAVTWPVFTLPAAFLLSNARPERRLSLDVYVLINNELDPEFQVVPDRNVNIAGRAVSTMVKDQTRSVIFRTYQFAKQNGLTVQSLLYRREGASRQRPRVRYRLYAPALRVRLRKGAVGPLLAERTPEPEPLPCRAALSERNFGPVLYASYPLCLGARG